MELSTFIRRIVAATLLLTCTLSSCIGTSSLSVHLGERGFRDDDAFDEVADQPLVGAELVLGLLPWGLGIEAGLIASSDNEDVDLGSATIRQDAETLESYVGLRKTFRPDSIFRPYVGGGFSYIDADFDFDGGGSSDFEDSDGDTGYYAHAGLAWHLAFFRLGAEYRAVWGPEAEIDGEEFDLDYDQVSVFVGLNF